ncbi:dehydrogenase [Paenibacillus sp. GSMTC-2017]|uniref:dehydrogenase n=1 Tax=Paenibacillus sp. GSMTC-2017 TaxID=2794350 RepID=UPI0018D8FAD1|nr:dehydrogenase [Paenibacillus sp. GSMTC-2017]MBH5319157.1 dehydrogenase [Paenibacillus sp. GSMTC-2017]
MKPSAQKHTTDLPSARKIRRSCSNELYRTVKRLKLWVSKEKMDQAETLYFRKVVTNMQWIVDNKSNRRAQAEWWNENVSAEIAELWEVDRIRLCEAFREAYGG